MSNFSNDALLLHTVEMGLTATVIGGITNVSNDLNNEVASPETGDPFAETQVLTGQSPEGSITTESLSAILGAVGLTGLCITSDGTHPGVQYFAQKHAQCGVLGRAASGHMSKTYKGGHLTIESISGGQGKNVSVSLKAIAKSIDGSGSSYASSTAATLPSGVVTEQFGIGKPTILGTVVDRVEQVDVNYNSTIEKSNDADTIYPTDLDPQFFGISIDITARSPELYGSPFPLTAKHTNNDTKLRYIRRVTAASEAAAASNGGFVDFGALKHIVGNVTGLVTVSSDYSASGRAASRIKVHIDGLFGATAPLVWLRDQAYSLS